VRNRATVLIRARIDEIPFDLRTDKYLSYEPTSAATAVPPQRNALDRVRGRLGPAAADQALAAGEALHFAAAVEHARQVIKR
jgi:hypothetical protein